MDPSTAARFCVASCSGAVSTVPSVHLCHSAQGVSLDNVWRRMQPAEAHGEQDARMHVALGSVVAFTVHVSICATVRDEEVLTMS